MLIRVWYKWYNDNWYAYQELLMSFIPAAVESESTPIADLFDPSLFVALCNLKTKGMLPKNLIRLALAEVLDGRVQTECERTNFIVHVNGM